MTSAWLLLIAAGALEIVWAVALEQAQGFTRLWPSMIGLSAATISFVLLSLALRVLPVGTSYAVWVGIGVVGVAGYGIVFNGESASIVRLLAIFLILVAVVVLSAVER